LNVIKIEQWKLSNQILINEIIIKIKTIKQFNDYAFEFNLLDQSIIEDIIICIENNSVNSIGFYGYDKQLLNVNIKEYDEMVTIYTIENHLDLIFNKIKDKCIKQFEVIEEESITQITDLINKLTYKSNDYIDPIFTNKYTIFNDKNIEIGYTSKIPNLICY